MFVYFVLTLITRGAQWLQDAYGSYYVLLSIYDDTISDTLTKSISISHCPLIACSKGVKVTLSCYKPTIKFDFPSNKASTALTPSLDAKTLSKHEGEPPRCMCPNTETLTSYSGIFSSI